MTLDVAMDDLRPQHAGHTLQAGSGGPLEGVRVIDLTLAMAGPLCTQRLGELGADVIKIEAPNGGDFSRHWKMAGVSAFGDALPFVTLNRNKRSLVLNLKSTDGLEVLRKLVSTADVLVQNYRPSVAERLGIDFASLKPINPMLVYVAISGYGDTGPMVARPGQDLLVQSFTGLTFNGGRHDGLPHASPAYMVDTVASHLACEAVLSGLVSRAGRGRGAEFKVSLMQAVMEMQIQEITASLYTGQSNRRSTSPQVSIWMEPPYGIYETANGYLAIAQADLDVLGKACEMPELSELKQTRPSNSDQAALEAWRDKIYFIVQETLRERSAADWDGYLSGLGIWCAVVNDYEKFLAHPQVQDSLVTINHPLAGPYRTVAPAIREVGAPAPKLTAAPAYGSSTKVILGELGYSLGEIDRLLSGGMAVAG